MKHRKHHAWFSVINRNKIKSGNVFNQPIEAHNKNIDDEDKNHQELVVGGGDNFNDLDKEHQRQLRSVISAAALTSAQTGKNI